MDFLDDIKKQIKDAEKGNFQGIGQEVPEGYFESLEERLIAKIPVEKTIRRRIPMWNYGAVAAAACLVLVAVFTFQMDESIEPAKLVLNEVSAEESVQFLLSVNDNLENEDMLEIENIDEILKEMEEELQNTN